MPIKDGGWKQERNNLSVTMWTRTSEGEAQEVKIIESVEAVFVRIEEKTAVINFDHLLSTARSAFAAAALPVGAPVPNAQK